MPLADLGDINQHLPGIAQLTDLTDDDYQEDAERIVRGYLSNVYSASTIAGWMTPSTTPELIRSIAGRLIAAKYYAAKVSGEVAEWNEYSDALYKEAISMLESVQSGDLVLTDVAEEPTTGDHITSDSFYPNDLTVAPPKFSMDMEFAGN
jgi:hypothetical protein